MGIIQLQVVDHSVPSDWWKKLVKHFVHAGNELEIRCWKEETAEIKQASRYGKPLEDGLEISIKGMVTDALLTELLAEAPVDKEAYEKITKYFSIRAKRETFEFSSEHYGTELYIIGISNEDFSFFSQIIAPYANYLSIYTEESD